jgi:hypothetical protein
MASTAKALIIVEESLTFNSGINPVRISQIPSNSIPRFLPPKLFVNFMVSPSLEKTSITRLRVMPRPGAVETLTLAAIIYVRRVFADATALLTFSAKAQAAVT